jgi:hypothetical protein
MAVALNRKGLEHAKELVSRRKVDIDDREAWSEHQPSHQQKTTSSTHKDSRSMESGIWESTTRRTKTPNEGMNSLMVTSRRFTAAQCFPRRAGQDNTSTSTLSAPPHTCRHD